MKTHFLENASLAFDVYNAPKIQKIALDFRIGILPSSEKLYLSISLSAFRQRNHLPYQEAQQ